MTRRRAGVVQPYAPIAPGCRPQSQNEGAIVSTMRVRHSKSSRARSGTAAGRGGRSPAGRLGTRALAVAMVVASVVAVVCTWAGVAELRGKAAPWAGLWLAKAADGVAAWPASWGGRPQIVGAPSLTAP